MNEVVQEMFEAAIKKYASDISLHPKGDMYEIRLTIMGINQLYQVIDFEKGQQIINNLKFRSSMSLSEHRRPQTGAMTIRDGVYSRMASVGDFLGREAVVIRLIYQRASDLNEYFFEEQLNLILSKAQNKGLILFSGPVGSGKTSTMYQIARKMGQRVMTIEDPVEIFEPKFLQLQVNNMAQMDYSSLIKATLRHRFDVLIVGEIRDEETARNTVKAALGGQLVLSTVHALNATGVVNRMLDFGIKNVDLRQTLRLINYQRLIPTTKEGRSKVLFEQLTNEQLESEETTHAKISHDWSERLAECMQEKSITEDTFEKFKEG